MFLHLWEAIFSFGKPKNLAPKILTHLPHVAFPSTPPNSLMETFWYIRPEKKIESRRFCEISFLWWLMLWKLQVFLFPHIKSQYSIKYVYSNVVPRPIYIELYLPLLHWGSLIEQVHKQPIPLSPSWTPNTLAVFPPSFSWDLLHFPFLIELIIPFTDLSFSLFSLTLFQLCYHYWNIE